MKKNKEITAIAFVVLFCIEIVVLGAASFVKLVNFYVNDETDYNEWSADLGNKFETDEATSFYRKFQFVNLNGAIRNLLGQREMNGVQKLNNGYLTLKMNKTSDETLQEYADNVVKLSKYLEKQGKKLLYVTTPYTVSKYDEELPIGVEDYGNHNIDRFLTLLDSEGIAAMDLRELMYKDHIDQYTMMYKTDHHWTTRAGFYAYCKLEEYLKQEFQCEVDNRICDINNYEIEIYEKWHLGSNGQRTGIYFAGIDDFELIIPKFETTIQRGETNGTMQELIYNREPLLNKQYTSRYTYDYVLNAALDNYRNLDCKNNLKILIVTDSYGKAVTPFLIMGFSEVRFLYDRASEQLTKDYIDSYCPDIVILMYYPDFLSEGSLAFQFQGFDSEEQ